MALAAACSQLAHEVAPGKDILNAQRGGYITQTDLAAGYHHAMMATEYW